MDSNENENENDQLPFTPADLVEQGYIDAAVWEKHMSAFVFNFFYTRSVRRAYFTMEECFTSSPSINTTTELNFASPPPSPCYGLSPPDIQPNDVVYVVRGCSHPVIAHPSPDAPGRWEWIGCADIPRHRYGGYKLLDRIDATAAGAAGAEEMYPGWNGLWEDVEFC